jgi:hypothetical protein
MEIDEVIKILTKIYQSIDKSIPQTITSPDGLVNHLNDLYSKSAKSLALEELFAYDDVITPSITLTVRINAEFDLRKIMENMRARLPAKRHHQADEMGKKGIVWSHGRYDFVYDDDSELLRVSHKYSHKRSDTNSVLSIIKKMIGYTKDYLEEVKNSVEENTNPDLE